MSTKILCLHQGAELYGSDRSFLSAVGVLKTSKAKQIDVVLPCKGPLATELERMGLWPQYYGKGVLRRGAISRPMRFAYELLASVLFYARTYGSHDVIYINTVVMLGPLLAAVLYRYSKKDVVCHVREIPPPALIAVLRVLFILGRVRLIFNSKATRDAFSLPGEVIYNGVDAGTATDLAEPRCGRINILLIGRINTWKGQDLLLSSLALLSDSDRCRLSVRIVGSAFSGCEYLEHALRGQLARLQLEPIVEFLPFTDEPSRHYRWADYVVVPSTRPEPFGRVAIEAFSFGKPVIAASHGGLREIVTNHVNGFLFEPGNAVELAGIISQLSLIQPDRYRALSLAAAEDFTARFSLSRYGDRIRWALGLKDA